jgi:hypothetical protein
MQCRRFYWDRNCLTSCDSEYRGLLSHIEVVFTTQNPRHLTYSIDRRGLETFIKCYAMCKAFLEWVAGSQYNHIPTPLEGIVSVW